VPVAAASRWSVQPVTWVKIDDKLTTHPKWLGLSLEAKSLWFHATVWCGAHNNDGVLPDDSMLLHAFAGSVPADKLEEAAARLVKARLWRRRTKAEGGGWEIVNWLEYQPSRQQVKDRADTDDAKVLRKRQHDWLHKKVVGKKVKAMIDARDGMWCRYCGAETVITPGDRRGPHRRTYDIVDPSIVWDLEVVAVPEPEQKRLAELWVIACGWCNAIKGQRSPAEAELVLLDAPRCRGIYADSVRNRSGTVPVVGTGLAGPDLAGPGRTGAGRVGTGAASHPPDPDPAADVHTRDEEAF